jgi:diguanylate cyclase (GGDEF)-like protein
MNTEHDQLTGLLSRKLIQEHLLKYSQCSIILLDIDKFQVFNACYGHTEGDQALITVAKVIRQIVPEKYKIFRSGGDEFTVMMERLPANQVIQLALQVRKAVKEQFSHLPVGQWFNLLADNSKARIQLIPFTLSCGIAFYPEHGQNFQHLREVLYDSVFNQGEDNVIAVARF